MEKIKKDITILFDLDGTLIDSTEAILESFYYAFKDQKYNFDGDDENIKKEIGYPLDIMFENLGVQRDIVWDFVDSYKIHYRKISKEKTFMLEGAIESVKLASTFARIGVVTTKTTQYSIPLLEYFGIIKYFETIIGRQEVENPKPHPEPIYKALENMDIKPSSNVYMIGDTKLDLIASQSAKISAIGVLCGYGKKEELLKYTSQIATNSLEAIKIIKNSN